MPPKFNNFFLAIIYFDQHITTWGPWNNFFYWKIKCLSRWKDNNFRQNIWDKNVAHIYRWNEDNFGHNIWDKIVMLLGTSWGAQWKYLELHDDHLGTWWVHIGNNIKQKTPTSHPTLIKRKNPKHVACMWLHSFIG